MRGATDDVAGPALSLAAGLPAAFFAGPLVGKLLDAFDAVLAPVISTLDDLDAYLDPRYAPTDFARWIAGWLSAAVDERWPEDRIRAHMSDLSTALTQRGTVAGMSAAVRACTDREVVVSDSGGVSWSGRPNGALPGRPGARVTVEVGIGDDDQAARSLVEAVIADAKPAHVRVDLRFDGDSQTSRTVPG